MAAANLKATAEQHICHCILSDILLLLCNTRWHSQTTATVILAQLVMGIARQLPVRRVLHEKRGSRNRLTAAAAHHKLPNGGLTKAIAGVWVLFK